MEMVLPFGLERERPPKNNNAQEEETLSKQINKFRSQKHGLFRQAQKQQEKETDEPWAPRLKQVQHTENQHKYKSTLLVLRHDPAEKKVMYFQQDLMARPILTLGIEKRTGFTYFLEEGKNVMIRKYLTPTSESKFLGLLEEFLNECNRVLFMYCETK